MPHDVTALGSGASAVHVSLLVSTLLGALGCESAPPPDLAALRAEVRELRHTAWEARRQATRAGVRADAAIHRAYLAEEAAIRAEATAAALEPAPLAVVETPLLPADRVVVRKAERVLELHREGNVLRSFPIALGFEPEGHKRRQGDGRTPEGVYVVDARHETRRYGPGLHISYPRPEDVRSARERGVEPGGGIFIHGLPVGLSIIGEAHADFDWTNGCIAVTDAQLEEIWARVADGTPIEILP